MQILVSDPAGEDVRQLLADHLADMFATSPPESVHALDSSALSDPAVTFFTARDNGAVLGCGALKELTSTSAEIKSMRTAEHARGRGVATALLERLMLEARDRGYTSVSLETGPQDFFAPARRLDSRYGFTECGPFADYALDPYSVYMTLSLHAPADMPVK